MNKQEAIKWFKEIGLGTYTNRTEFLDKFGAGEIARDYWHDPIFTLGIEYGILIALTNVFDISLEDLGEK